ncbi:DNA recombination protein RmuC [Pistricoccus aurantiacus]|uniref:DNA recombination protein RmuC n=1 Tax=Pistricoccus aurantiacus TaxID=1883414 RepID=A0A5B8SRZ9_9GAMM|nr:DNA recombination protein RmuC [Pistricoccus aurantiacus]QEA38235.1 DNA recombination protein RmuC [Pistricoccus aurantiacus]
MPADSLIQGSFILAALAVGVLLTYLLLRGKLISREETLKHQLEERQRLESELGESRQLCAAKEQALHEERLTNARLSSQLESTHQTLADFKTQFAQLQQQHRRLERENSDIRTRHQELITTLEQRERHFKEQLALVNEGREQLKQEFENLANEVLERKGKSFSELSERHISHLLQPMHTEMKGFRERIENLHHQDTQQQAALKQELKTLQNLNREITDQAERLTEALQGQKKIQGNWGELMLENVLDGCGLRLGKDYRREVSFNTEDGRRRPDAIVYLPQNRHLVIDAKTSLSAYVRYVNSDEDIQRAQALADHCRAVSDRINELADKHYYDLPGLNSPEVVVMFIPVESAYVEAIKHDETLYQRAIENNVLVATPTTLLTSLNIVRQLWRFEDQSKHSVELAKRAEGFYNKLRTFLESMQDVGKRLDGARLSFNQAMGQFSTGKGNLLKQASEFQELGVSVKKELPAELVERARMELPQRLEHSRDEDQPAEKV